MKLIFRTLLLAMFGFLAASCSKASTSFKSNPPSSSGKYNVLNVSDVVWDQLNPARGDQSPEAGALWGNRIGPGAAGFLLKPVDGFRSPPHIHNVAYRGVVISDYLHNDDPEAADMWMGVGSFWTQPAGEIHITAAKGKNTLAYIEVEDCFGVFPPDELFDSGEKPMNVDASNIVWLDSSNQMSLTDNAEVAWLWGNPSNRNPNGSFLKLKSGFSGTIHSDSEAFIGIIISGQITYSNPEQTNPVILNSGSMFSSEGFSRHSLTMKIKEECVIYIRSNGSFKIME